VEELKTTPVDAQPSAPALAAQALDQELNAGSSSKIPQAAINDLTSMVVKKKKKPAGDEGTAKRKAGEDDGGSTPPEKKARLESTAS
jgi:HAT1-interacting factor 1